MGLEPEVACRARQSKSRLAMLKVSLTFPVRDTFISLSKNTALS